MDYKPVRSYNDIKLINKVKKMCKIWDIPYTDDIMVKYEGLSFGQYPMYTIKDIETTLILI